MKIEIKSRFTNESELLFAHDCENNTIKITVEAAVKGGAFLDGAFLGGAFLRGASLDGAFLRGAFLRGASLRGASLGGASLDGAFLDGASLGGAFLRGASLGGAFLDGASLGGAFLRDKENPIESIKQIGNIGSRGGFTIAFKCKKSIEINCGCFWGTIEEFEEAVKEKHAGTKYETEYMAAIEFFRKVL